MTGGLAVGVWLALALVDGVACASPPASPAPAANQKGKRMTDPGVLFDEAVLAVGQAYLDREAALRAADGPLAPVLARQRFAADPIAQLLADVLTQASAGKSALQLEAIQYLDEIGERMKPTALGKPSPTGVAKYLENHFADGVVELLALRLHKESGWPFWREAGVLLYLDRHAARRPLITVPLIRAAARASGDLREQVVITLEKQADAMLLDRLRAERERAHTAGQAWPSELLILEQKRRRAAGEP